MNATIKTTAATTTFVLAALLAPAASAAATEAGLHGRVVETTPQGRIVGMAPNAKVELFDEAGKLIAAAQSNASGYYRTPLAPGRYYYRVTAQGFRTENSGRGFEHRLINGYSLKSFALVRGQSSPEDGNISPQADGVGELYGRVSVRAKDGKLVPAPGAQIRLRRIDSSEMRTISVSAAPQFMAGGGVYQYALPSGEWRASVDAAGMQRLVTEPIKITAARKTERNFILEPVQPQIVAGRGIRGVVTFDRRAPSAGSSPPITLVFRAVRPTPAFQHRLEQNAAGEFSQDLPVGLYCVAAFAKGCHPDFSHPILVNESGYASVRLRLTHDAGQHDQPPQDSPSTHEKLPPRASLTVTAIGKSSDGLVRLSNAKITLQQFDGERNQPIAPELQEHSGPDGSAAFVNLTPGRYLIGAAHAGFETAHDASRDRGGQGPSAAACAGSRHRPAPIRSVTPVGGSSYAQTRHLRCVQERSRWSFRSSQYARRLRTAERRAVEPPSQVRSNL
jgi:hypothetical protein